MRSKPSLNIESKELQEIYAIDKTEGVPEFKTFLAGEWASGEEWLNVRTPIDLSIFAKVSKTTQEQIERVLDVSCKKGKWAIRDLPGEKRLELYERAAQTLERFQKDIANVLMLNTGKTYPSSLLEVRASIERLRKSNLDTRRILGDYVPGDWSEETLETEAIVKREPLGVVLAIVPFNYPLFDIVNKLVYSTITGNSIIIKPASATPLPAILLARILELSGFPKDSFSVLTVEGKEMGKILGDKRINGISFTGNSKTGAEVLKSSGIKQFVMELGGGDPAIVMDDADVPWAAQRISRGIYSYTGQRCDAIKMILAEEGIYDPIKEKVVGELKGVKVGDPREPEVMIGPLIDERAGEQVAKAIEDAKQNGGTVLCGGALIGRNYIEPTLIEIPKEKIANLYLYENEVFAPVALLAKISDIEEAIAITNDRVYGLDAAIFGKDLNRIRRLTRMLDVGSVYINDYPRHGIGYFPFGGRKESGIGREGIGYTAEYVTSYKSIIYNYKGKGIWEYL